MRLKKHLGQHFLRDAGSLRKLLQFINPRPADLFLEIGAGMGALSRRLAPEAGTLLALEVDRDCIEALRTVLSPYPNASPILGDVMRVDLLTLVQPHLKPDLRLRIAGNLPYNLATAIIERMLRTPLQIEDMVFLVQLEVAERITASPGSKAYGFFSVICQYFCQTRLGPRIVPACFMPPPKVMSAAVALNRRPIVRDPEFESRLAELVKAAFAHRRKTLANSLRNHRAIRPLTSLLLAESEIDGSMRAEQLSVAEFERMARIWCSLDDRQCR
jgi:16S rRNA (adenine1518-N6/adenine1519-N6)-dimethyltransferase